MRCPVCQTDDCQLVQRARRGVTVDLCPGCRGMWLDAGELDAIVGERFDGAAVEAALVSSRRAATRCRDCGASSPADAPARCGACGGCVVAHCPRDASAMDIVELGDIELDRCPQCAGLWVDGDERGPLGGHIRSHMESAATASPPVLELDETRLPGAVDLESEVTCAGCRREVPRFECVSHREALWCERCVITRRVPGLDAPSVTELHRVAASTFAMARAEQATRREAIADRAARHERGHTRLGGNTAAARAFGEAIVSLRGWFSRR